MNATVVQALVRHLLTAVGGGFFAAYGITGSTFEVVVGALSTLAGVAWSLYDKRKVNQGAPDQPAEQGQSDPASQ